MVNFFIIISSELKKIPDELYNRGLVVSDIINIETLPSGHIKIWVKNY